MFAKNTSQFLVIPTRRRQASLTQRIDDNAVGVEAAL